MGSILLTGAGTQTPTPAPAPSLPTVVYSGASSSVSQAVVAGHRYVMGTWSGAGSAINGSVVTPKVTSGGTNPPIYIYEYLATSTGSITFDAGAGTIEFIADIGTSLSYNGTSQTIDVDNHSGAFTLGAITGMAFAVFVSTGGISSINLTLLSAGTDPNFFAYAASGSPTIAGSWSGFNGAAAIGLS